MNQRLHIDYSRLKRPVFVLMVVPLVVVTYLSIIYFHPENNQWLFNGSFSWSNFWRFVLIDQIAIESLTYLIIGLCTATYARLFSIEYIGLSLRELLIYQIRFLPLFLVVFFIFNPVTQTVRYWYHYFPDWNPDVYFDSYFYSRQLYLTYMFPVVLGGYILLNLNLYINYQQHLQLKSIVKNSKIEAFDKQGRSFLDTDSIISIERIGRDYLAFTGDHQFKIRYPLKKLEDILDKERFYRINRAAIVNLEHVKNYSFWEHDKYILRLDNGKEYVASRDRIKRLKNEVLQTKTSIT